MKKLLIILLVSHAFVNFSFAQVLSPVKWTLTVEENGTEATLNFKAIIEEGWHIYSQFTPDGGPLPTVFTFEENACYQLEGKVSEPRPHEEFDPTFEVKVLTLDGQPAFTQKIKLKEGPCTIKGRVDGQVCKEVCIMFGSDFTFEAGKSKVEGSIKN